ncbi:MAG: hypothetical protein RIS70_3737 [Planctomycetota bacterium]
MNDEIESLSEVEAKIMVQFFVNQMQSHSPRMDGTCKYRFMNGWPMTHCVGSSAIDAVKNAIAEVEREDKRRGNE